MLPANILNALKSLALAPKQQLPAAAVDAVKAIQFEVGQQLQGNVQAQVAPNIFKVNVAGQMIQMQLPASIRSGDTVALQVIGIQPRLTFSMVNSANPLSTPEQLGSTARILSALSREPPEKAYVRAAQSTPLWESPNPPEGKQLAGMLREALSNSGLFYESHQAQWVEGGRSTAQLRQEPQNLPPEQARAVTAKNAALTAKETNQSAVRIEAAAGNNAPAQVASDAQPARSADMPRTMASSVDASSAQSLSQSSALPELKASGIPDHLQPLVQQQLNALETRQMAWQGNVWPGQAMEWEIQEQAPKQASEENQRQWVTQIRLGLPNLGDVTATLRLNSAGLSLVLNADTAETRAALGAASSQLVTVLSDAGIRVVGTQVGAA